jgi:hypothetical protein
VGHWRERQRHQPHHIRPLGLVHDRHLGCHDVNVANGRVCEDTAQSLPRPLRAVPGRCTIGHVRGARSLLLCPRAVSGLVLWVDCGGEGDGFDSQLSTCVPTQPKRPNSLQEKGGSGEGRRRGVVVKEREGG